MIPQFEQFLYPSLLAFKDGAEKSVTDVRLFNVKYLNLTEDDCKELIKSGLRTKVQDRTGFSITYLYQAGLITRVKRGIYQITESGKVLLNNGKTSISKKYLEETYPSFYDYAYNKGKSTVNEKHAEEITELTPQEQMEVAFDIISKDLACQLLEEVKAMSPKFFERLVVKLLVAMGYGGSEDDAFVTKYSHDDGIDGIIKEDKLGLSTIYLQAKRYTTNAVQM